MRTVNTGGLALALATGLACGVGLPASVADSSGWALDAVAAASNDLARIESMDLSSSSLMRALVALGDAHLNALQYDEAVACYDRAVAVQGEAFQGIRGDLHPDLLQRVRLLAKIGDTHLRKGDYESAERAYVKGLKVARLGLSQTTPEVKRLRTGRAAALSRRFPREKAERLLEQLLQACEEASGAVHADVATVLNQWLMVRAVTRRLAESEDLASRLVDVRRRVYGSDHPEVAEALVRLASVFHEKGELARAEEPLEAALKIRRSAFGNDHPLTQKAKANLSRLR